MSFPSDRIKTDAERSRTHAAAATPLTPSVAAAPTENPSPSDEHAAHKHYEQSTSHPSSTEPSTSGSEKPPTASDSPASRRTPVRTACTIRKPTPGGPCGRRFDLELGVSSKHEYTIAGGHRPAEGVQQSLSHHPWHLGEPAAHPPHLSTAAVHPAPEPRGGGSPPIAAPPSMVSMSRIPPKLSRAGVARKALLGGVGGCD